jgi:hypothetical protein
MNTKMKLDRLEEIFIEMRQFDESRNYYAFTFTANDAGGITFSTTTEWRGWGDDQCKTEIRIPSLVNPVVRIKYWQLIKQPYLVVNKDEHYFLYGFLGGNALVDAEIVQRMEPSLLEPDISVRTGDLGFVSIKSLPTQAYTHAPSPKHRMRILKRDGYRCRICGRKPADYTDLELHVHHIRPFGEGGLTEDRNLITLCHTCHKGLKPHGNITSLDITSIDIESNNFLQSVIRYRDVFWNAYSKIGEP